MPVPQAQVYSTLTNQQQQLMNQLQKNVQTAGKPTQLDPSATTAYINKSVAQPLLQQYDQVIMPRLKDSFAAVGALMSSRRGFASQQALGNLQTTIAAELGKAQLQNQQLAAQQALQYNQLGAGLVGQSHMAIQPYIDSGSMFRGLQNQFANQGYGGGSEYKGPQNAAALGAQLSGPKLDSIQQNRPQSFSDFLDQMLNDPESQLFEPQGDFPDYGYSNLA